jgi:hypothetical protein
MNLVNGIEPPFLLIITLRDGGKRVAVSERERASMQLLRILRGELKSVELIDRAGRYFSHVTASCDGINWSVYLESGWIAPIVFILDLLFVSLMIQVRLHADETPAELPLKEMKSKVSAAILSNPGVYTHAPVESILGRIRVAKTAESLIRGIYRG